MKFLKLCMAMSYMGCLYVLSSLPGKETSENVVSMLPSLLQNLLHVPAYGVLTLLWIITFKAYHCKEGWAILLAASLAMFYGAALELHQASVPGRFSSLMDFALNLIGIVLFSAGYRFVIQFICLKNQHRKRVFTRDIARNT